MKLKHIIGSAALGVAAVSAALLFGTQTVRADNVRIIVNGSEVTFDQPPIERGGRVFVPLRGVFERLGASVVYDNGTINASGAGHNVQLRIGSTNAIVDGGNRQLDVAPFLVGYRTLVPLRFISESLGANVNYDDTSRTVTIGMGGAPPPPPQASVTLSNLRPENGGVIQANRPAVSGTFSTAVDPNSVKITLDARDVSSTSYVSKNDFLFTPTYDLTPQQHTVEITGRSAGGTSFDRTWTFTSGVTATQNFLHNLLPANGSTVGSTFTVSGTTLPNAKVRVAATASALYGGIFRANLGTYTTDITADGAGRFSAQVTVQAVSGGNVTVRITSTEPTTNAGASATLNLNS